MIGEHALVCNITRRARAPLKLHRHGQRPSCACGDTPRERCQVTDRPRHVTSSSAGCSARSRARPATSWPRRRPRAGPAIATGSTRAGRYSSEIHRSAPEPSRPVLNRPRPCRCARDRARRHARDRVPEVFVRPRQRKESISAKVVAQGVSHGHAEPIGAMVAGRRGRSPLTIAPLVRGVCGSTKTA